MSKVYRSISDSSWAHSPVNTQMIGLHSFFPMLFYSKYIQNIIMSRQVCRWGFPKPRLLPTILGWPLVLKTAVGLLEMPVGLESRMQVTATRHLGIYSHVQPAAFIRLVPDAG